MAEDRNSNRGQRGPGGSGRPGGKDFGSRGGKYDRGGKFDRSGKPERGGKFDRGGKKNFGGKSKFSAKNKPHHREYRSADPNEPVIPAGVTADELDADALKALKTLSGANQEIVARHLVTAGQLLDIDPELAYQHAQAAVRRAGRVDVVREAAALTAYVSGRYDEALREVRAVRRMRGDVSLRAIEADCERGLGRPERAIEIVEETDTSQLSLEDQVELILVAAGARADLGQMDYSLMIVENALRSLPEDTPSELLRRLGELRAERLQDLGRLEEAAQVLDELPPEEDPMEIVDLDLLLEADVDKVRTDLRGGGEPLAKMFDGALLDLDGVCYAGAEVIAGGPGAIDLAEDHGMQIGFLTNNSSRSPQAVADKLSALGYVAEANQVMTSAMDLLMDLKEKFEPGTKILVTGSEELARMTAEAGFEVVGEAAAEPAAVVQGLSQDLGWAQLTEAALAIQAGAIHFATNLDPKLPTERGFAVGNGSLVAAVRNATGVRPIAAGKPRPDIFIRAAQMLRMERPLVIGDQLSTDIAGAVSAKMASLHVLTGVSDARDIVLAPRGQRPSFVALDLNGLNEVHPRPRHHRDGTWTCGVSQVVAIDRRGRIRIGEAWLTGSEELVTLNLDTYRALIAAAWEIEDERTQVACPPLKVVPNDDETGVVEPAPEPEAETAPVEENGPVEEHGPVEEAGPETAPVADAEPEANAPVSDRSAESDQAATPGQEQD